MKIKFLPGFQLTSNIITRLAEKRLTPSPPAIVDIRNKRPRGLSGSLKVFISAALCLIGTCPLIKK